MIRKLTEFEPYWDFIKEINADPRYREPMLSSKEQIEGNLLSALTDPDKTALGVFEDDVMTGLFVFLIIKEERYIEMLVGLSRDPAAYEEIADWLAANCPGCQVDFVFHPKNDAIRYMLEKRGASFDPEQFKMVLTEDPPAVDTTGIEPLSAQYEEQYIAMHDTNRYWTGDKVVKAPDIFRVLVAAKFRRDLLLVFGAEIQNPVGIEIIRKLLDVGSDAGIFVTITEFQQLIDLYFAELAV